MTRPARMVAERMMAGILGDVCVCVWVVGWLVIGNEWLRLVGCGCVWMVCVFSSGR